MGLFKRSSAQQVVIGPNSAAAPNLGTEIQRQLQSAGSRVFAYSDHVMQVDCSRCGAPKQLPSKTAYLYCDHCGALVDYDFRAANFGTNAALANQVFGHLIGPVQAELNRAVVNKDKDHYREVLRPVYEEWIRQVPQAVSPRATSDEEFRARTVRYQVECMVSREFTPALHGLGYQLQSATNAVQRLPQPDGTVLVGDGIWQVAALFKQQTEATYQVIVQDGVLALEPDDAPLAVQLRMEYSYFCQNWLPKIPPADRDRFLDFFGLTNDYKKANIADASTRKCGNCGDELKTVAGAQAVICESCGRKLDIGGGEVPCQSCGAPLSFPVGVSAIECPFCHAGTHRV